MCVGVLHTNSNGSEAFIQTISDFFLTLREDNYPLYTHYSICEHC